MAPIRSVEMISNKSSGARAGFQTLVQPNTALGLLMQCFYIWKSSGEELEQYYCNTVVYSYGTKKVSKSCMISDSHMIQSTTFS